MSRDFTSFFLGRLALKERGEGEGGGGGGGWGSNEITMKLKLISETFVSKLGSAIHICVALSVRILTSVIPTRSNTFAKMNLIPV